jgi:hypothetical protein
MLGDTVGSALAVSDYGERVARRAETAVVPSVRA